MSFNHYAQANKISRRIFEYLRGPRRNSGLIGIPLYVAFTISKTGLKIFEINSRGGDSELIDVLVKLDDDFVDVCYQMLNGNLRRLRFRPLATVSTYLVPHVYPGKDDIVRRVDLKRSIELSRRDPVIKVYPGAIDSREDGLYVLSSRAVCSVGMGKDIEEARENSLQGVHSVQGNDLRFRHDIASREHIKRSIEHVESLSGWSDGGN